MMIAMKFTTSCTSSKASCHGWILRVRVQRHKNGVEITLTAIAKIFGQSHKYRFIQVLVSKNVNKLIIQQLPPYDKTPLRMIYYIINVENTTSQVFK
jgi:hypothetical protein